MIICIRLLELTLSKTVGTSILVSGDGDLVPAVESANYSGATVKLHYAKVRGAWTIDTLIKTCTEKKERTQHDLECFKLSNSGEEGFFDFYIYDCVGILNYKTAFGVAC